MKFFCRVDDVIRREGFERAAMWRHNIVLLSAFTWTGPDMKPLWTIHSWAASPEGFRTGAPTLKSFQPEHAVENHLARQAAIARSAETPRVPLSLLEDGLSLYMDPLKATIEAQALGSSLQNVAERISSLCNVLEVEKDLDHFYGSVRILGASASLHVGEA